MDRVADRVGVTDRAERDAGGRAEFAAPVHRLGGRHGRGGDQDKVDAVPVDAQPKPRHPGADHRTDRGRPRYGGPDSGTDAAGVHGVG